jgi:hypothetical protein
MAPFVVSNYNLTLEHLFRKSPFAVALRTEGYGPKEMVKGKRIKICD